MIQTIERLLSGYILDFTDQTFQSFFRDYNIDIDDKKYMTYGNSKGKRLRAFWEIDSNETVSLVMSDMLKLKNYTQCEEPGKLQKIEGFLKELKDQ